MRVTGEWIGRYQANGALRRLPDFVKAEVQQTIDVTAFQVFQGARDRVRRRTGFLASQIDWASRPRSLSAIVGVIPGAAFYWKFLEYGTVRMSAKPFMRPAAAALEDDHAQRLTQALERADAQLARETA